MRKCGRWKMENGRWKTDKRKKQQKVETAGNNFCGSVGVEEQEDPARPLARRFHTARCEIFGLEVQKRAPGGALSHF
jgi:hypothetical protein